MTTTQQLLQLCMLGACLATAAVWDLLRRRIPNWVNVATATLGVGVAALSGSVWAVAQALAGGALLFALLFAAYRKRWVGGGDVKLGAAIGTWLGPVSSLYALVLGIGVSGVLAVVLLLRRGRAFRGEVKSNLLLAYYTGRVGETAHRPDAAHVPLGAALAAAAMFVDVARGGIGA